MDNIFETLNKVNVNDHTEKKNGLTYLSWAWAWAEVKKAYPEANYKIYENNEGWNYFTDGKTCWVKTGVTIGELEHIEYLPIMDFRNKSISADQVTSVDVNKAIQRSLTKACARHGLGLYIYAGEDLPEGEEAPTKATDDKMEFAELKTKLLAYINRHNMPKEDIQKICHHYKVNSLNELKLADCKDYIKKIEEKGGSIDE